MPLLIMSAFRPQPTVQMLAGSRVAKLRLIAKGTSPEATKPARGHYTCHARRTYLASWRLHARSYPATRDGAGHKPGQTEAKKTPAANPACIPLSSNNQSGANHQPL